MIEIFYHPYKKELLPSETESPKKSHLKTRKGALLKVHFSKDRIGFADLCPFPYFGDPEIEDFLFDNPVTGRDPLEAPILQRSLDCALEDSKARVEKKNLYRKTPIRNHYLISTLLEFSNSDLERARAEGFDTFKIKIGSDLDLESKALLGLIDKLEEHEFLRLDFNHCLDHHQAERWLEKYSGSLKKPLPVD